MSRGVAVQWQSKFEQWCLKSLENKNKRIRAALVFTFNHHCSNFEYHCTATPRDILQQHVGKRKTQSSRLDSMHLPEEEESAWQGCR
jgi:hypothetical protein